MISVAKPSSWQWRQLASRLRGAARVSSRRRAASAPTRTRRLCSPVPKNAERQPPCSGSNSGAGTGVSLPSTGGRRPMRTASSTADTRSCAHGCAPSIPSTSARRTVCRSSHGGAYRRWLPHGGRQLRARRRAARRQATQLDAPGTRTTAAPGCPTWRRRKRWRPSSPGYRLTSRRTTTARSSRRRSAPRSHRQRWSTTRKTSSDSTRGRHCHTTCKMEHYAVAQP